MAYRHEANGSSGWRNFKLQIIVPQGSMPRHILLLIYINDLDEGVTCNILKLVDNTKCFRKKNGNGDKQHLQDDKLIKWSEKRQMTLLFNIDTCKYLHAGEGIDIVGKL